MSSSLDIKVNIHTESAASEVDQLDNKVKTLRTDAERPVNVHVNVDTAGATAGAGRLREALSNVRATGLEELSQKAAQLGASLGGVAGNIAEVAIKSAASFGPVGVAITAVAAGLAFLKQAIDESNAATERTSAISESTAAANQALGGSYATVVAAANAATTAEAARLAVAREMQTIIQQQISLMSQGFNIAQAQQLTSAFQTLSNATRDARTGFASLTPAMIQHAAFSGNAAEQQRAFGTTLTFSANEATRNSQALQLLATATRNHARETLQAAMDERASAIAAVNSAREKVQANASDISAVRELHQAEERLRVARVNVTSATRPAIDAERSLASATRATAAATATANEEGKQLARSRLEEVAASARATARANAAATAEAARQAAITRAQARLTSQAAAAAFANNIESDAIDRRVAAVQRNVDATELLMGTRTLADMQAEESAAREEARTTRLAAAREAEADKERNLLNERARHAYEVSRRAESVSGIMGNAIEGAGNKAAQGFGAAYAAILEGGNVGDILQTQLKEILASIGQESAVQALFETAKGFAALANPITAATAPGHFASAGIFAATAVAAGAASAAIPAVASASSGGGGAATAAAKSSSPERTTPSSGSEAPKVINISLNAFQSNEQAQALIVRSLRESGYRGTNQIGSGFNSSRR